MFRRPFFLYLLSALLAIIFVFIIFFFVYKFKIKNYKLSPVAPVATATATPTPDPDRPFSFLLLGYGGAGHDGGGLTDSLIQAQIHPHQKRVDLISIPRDLWVEANGSASAKINSVFPLQGPEALKNVISQITAIPVDHYVAVDFAGFIKTVDLLGGIDLKIKEPFVDNFYPIDIGATDTCGKSPEEITALTATLSGEKLDQQFTCRYEHLVFNIGTTHLDGATALKYARSRHSPQSGGDFNRSNRQRQVILAIRDKVLSLQLFTKIIPIYKTLKSHVRTDLTLGEIEKYLLRVPEFSKYQVVSIPLTDKNVLKMATINHQSVLIPVAGSNDYTGIQQFIASSSATNANQ